MIDLLRSCYSADVRFFVDSDRTIRIHWYFTDGPRLPLATPFGSANWIAEKGQWVDDLGEVSAGFRPYRKGHRPDAAVFMGAPHYCGTPQQWFSGCAIADAHYVGTGDRDPCCPVAPPVMMRHAIAILTGAAQGLVALLGLGCGAGAYGPGPAQLSARLGSLQGTWGLPGASGTLLALAGWQPAVWSDTLSYGQLEALLGVSWAVHLVTPARGVFTAMLGLRQTLATTAQGLGVSSAALLWGLSAGALSAQRSALAAVLEQLLAGEHTTRSPAQVPPYDRVRQAFQVTMTPRQTTATSMGLKQGLEVTFASTQGEAMPGSWRKVVIPYTQFPYNAGSYTVVALPMAAGEALLFGAAQITQSWGVAGASAVIGSFGFAGGATGTPSNNGAYSSNINLGNPPSPIPTFWGPDTAGSLWDCENLTAAWSLTFTVSVQGGVLENLAQGSITLWVITSPMP